MTNRLSLFAGMVASLLLSPPPLALADAPSTSPAPPATAAATHPSAKPLATSRASTRHAPPPAKPPPATRPKLPPRQPLSMALPVAPTTLPFGLGVNIHFTQPRDGEMEQLAAAGFQFVRMDFNWAATEKRRGVYDFSDYDRLLDSLAPYGIRAVLILDYVNPLYDDAQSPHTDQGRRAFAAWAVAAANHFKGRGVLWEMYNEPNISQFWHPKENVDDYVKLALAVGKALKHDAPDAAYIGPACSTMDFPFLEACFKAGLLEYWDAVSVHPYRQTVPETVADDYRQLRVLIARYAPRGKSIAIYSGEWGYSSAWGGYDADRQGVMLARQWLTNLENDVPLSIWYDWHDDGPDAKEPEHHFGTVAHDYRAATQPVYEPKPAYRAAKTLAAQLAGYRFDKRLLVPGQSADDHVLLFSKSSSEQKLVAWTTGAELHSLILPGVDGTFSVTTHLGGTEQAIVADQVGLTIPLGPQPRYLTPTASSETLKDLAAWRRAPVDRVVRAPGFVGQRRVGRGDRDFALDTTCPSRPAFSQRTMVVVSNPVSVTVSSVAARGIIVHVDNASGEPLFGILRLVKQTAVQSTVRLAAGETATDVTLPVGTTSGGEPRVAVELLDDVGQVVVRTPTYRFAAIPFVAEFWQVRAEGDKKVRSTQSLAAGDRSNEVKLTYAFDPGWKYVCVQPAALPARPIDGRPASLGMWVRGDGNGNIARVRYVDDTRQTFQTGGDKVTWRDARHMSFPLDGTDAHHWGGANDGVVHYPIRLETLFLLDSAGKEMTRGEVVISDPTLVYQE